jgi:hypothetical protein
MFSRRFGLTRRCEMGELGKPLREKSTSRKAAHRNLDVGAHSTNEEGNHEKAGSVAVRHSKRLDRQNALVGSDVFIHRLERGTLEAVLTRTTIRGESSWSLSNPCCPISSATCCAHSSRLILGFLFLCTLAIA